MILLPSRRRVKLLNQFLDSFKVSRARSPGLILIDSKDHEENQGAYSDLNLPNDWRVVVTSGESMGDKVREVWPEVVAAKPNWVGLLNDDHYCVTPEWDKIVDELIDGTNMVSTNDGYWNFGVRVVGITAWSMPLLEAAGFPIFPRQLQHLYIDDVWKAIGESTGCWVETMRVNIEHRHATRGQSDQDDTFKKVYAQASWETDNLQFREFMEKDFKDVCQRVLKLRDEGVVKEKFV